MTGYLFFRRLKRVSGVVWLGCLVLTVLSVLSSVLFLGTDVPVEIGAKWAFILFVISSSAWFYAWFMVKLLEPIRHD
jgi:hypothetical protein